MAIPDLIITAHENRDCSATLAMTLHTPLANRPEIGRYRESTAAMGRPTVGISASALTHR